MNLPPVSILLLEDDPDLARMVTMSIEKNGGYSVTAIGEGKAGLKAGIVGSFDLCLLNVNLPDLSGFEIAEELQRRGSDMPLMFLTGAHKADVAEWARKQEFRVAYLQHPCSVSGLLQKIEEVLGGKGWLEVDRT